MLIYKKFYLWIFLGLVTFIFIQSVHFSKSSNISTPQVYFPLSESTISKNILTTNIAVNLSTTSQQKIFVDYLVTKKTANPIKNSHSKNYFLSQGTLVFTANTITKNIPVSILSTLINKGYQDLEIQLTNVKNANLSNNKSHTVRILDYDLKNIVSVRKFGAKGNGITDDTKAIQAAIDTVYQQGGGIISFPKGVYIVTSVILKDKIIYQGYGATIKRPDNQGKWMRTFTTNYSSLENSQPLIIQGFTFDGNSQKQGEYQKHELEQAHLIFLTADSKLPGKLQVFIEDCIFKNGVADGISVYTNVDVKINNCQATDVFRGGFVLTGGNSSAEVYNLTTKGKIDPTGIDIEVDGRGYGETLKVDVKFDHLNLIDGDFDIGVEEGSTVVGNHIISGNAPFYIFSRNSHLKFTNSQFTIGAADTYMNRILFPHNLIFENCQFTVARQLTDKSHSFFAGADVWWQHPSYPTEKNQLLVFDNCDFKLDKNFQKTDKIHAIYLRKDQQSNNNRLIIRGGKISQDFLFPIFRE